MKTALRILMASAALALAACATAPTAVNYRGQSVPVISGLDMNCNAPIAFTQDCSTNGARMRARAGDVLVRVAGSADGRAVLVTAETAFPSDQKSQEAAMAVQALAAPLGAQTLKVQGVATLGGTITGYVLQFDRDVYRVLRDNSLD